MALASMHSARLVSALGAGPAPRRPPLGASLAGASPTRVGSSRRAPPRASPIAAASSQQPLPETIAEALETCEAHVATAGADLYAVTPAVVAAVKTMVASKRVDGMSVGEILDASDGVWEVFSMPHMLDISRPLGVSFKPVRYVLKGGKIRSDVRFDAFDGRLKGWLDAAGTVKKSARTPRGLLPSDAAVELAFDDFWVGADGSSPRDSPTRTKRDPTDDLAPADAFVRAAGRAGFVDAFAVFPVHFFDERRGLCVFEFPPLNSFVACARVGSADDVVF